ncbi:MAG: TonB-dependent receptor plug domain-containing protein, partial [Longimicrobiales bacterium]
MSVLVLILAGVAQANGQQGPGIVAGQVVRAGTTSPLVGAQVVVVGSQLGALTNAEGRYIIRGVPAGNRTVRMQLMGYSAVDQAVTVTAGGTATANFAGSEQAVAISPVVITAMGVGRNEKSLGYAVQQISTEQIDRIPETTLVQALAGQSAGVSVMSSSGRPGAGARITIRGETSFSGTGQPLFVIDGMPIATNTDGPSNPLGQGSSGSRAMDIDMENIEAISVLRGAAATALYGSRAANGAVIIKTKSGRPGQPLRFSFNSEMRWDRPLLGGYITEYAGGDRGYFCNGKLLSQGGWCQPGSSENPDTGRNWGPHKDSIPQIVFDSVGEVRFRDAREDYYRTGLTSNNSLRAQGSMGEMGIYTFGVSYLDQGGIFPQSKLGRLNLNANVNLRLSNWLQSATSLQRIRTDNPFSDDSFDGLNHALIDLPPTRDVREAWNADGTPVMWGTNTPHIDWRAQNEYNTALTNRWILSQQFNFTIAPGITLSNNWGLDTYLDETKRVRNERPWRTSANLTSGSTRQRKNNRTTINDDLTLNIDGRRLGESGVTVSAMLGGNLYLQD